MQNINAILGDNPLSQLIQKDNFIGFVYGIDYDRALVMTNDYWKSRAKGIPHNCFLIGATFDTDRFAGVDEADKEVILLRVIGSAKLPQDDDMVRTKIDHFQGQTNLNYELNERDLDDLTLNKLQFGGLECRVLGTFYLKAGELYLGSDLESFATASRLKVYRPRGEALNIIANYIDPIRRRAGQEQAQAMGIANEVAPFQVGTVRYTSTDHMHRQEEADQVPVGIQPMDFLARRTAVLGMTRTGKSNLVKQLVSVVKRVSDIAGLPIGQIIYDINGEYANANQQDQGAIADVYPGATARYRMLEAEGFRELRTNFYEQLNEGFGIIQRELDEAGRVTTDYVRNFVNMSLDEPDQQERGEFNRWRVRKAAYLSLLYKAGFTPPANLRIKFQANQRIREAVNRQAGEDLPNPANGITVLQASRWFEAARTANRQNPFPSSTTGRNWVDDTLGNLLNMIAQRSDNDNFISGHRILSDARRFHSPTRNTDVAEEIYQELRRGKIVILDLSVGDPKIREKISKQIARKIFDNSMDSFVRSETPPNIVIYIEEAHNLIGKGADLTDAWPRIAKEGAKYRISLVYATQEVSSMHPNILANTENWFITHLNNEKEIRELARFYDFADFSRSLIRAQDVGFTRIKTLSGPYVIPVQIEKFDPQVVRQNG